MPYAIQRPASVRQGRVYLARQPAETSPQTTRAYTADLDDARAFDTQGEALRHCQPGEYAVAIVRILRKPQGGSTNGGSRR